MLPSFGGGVVAAPKKKPAVVAVVGARVSTGRPNGKSWKKSWKGVPPTEIVEKATEQSRKAKRGRFER
jgi:hypothetical protein